MINKTNNNKNYITIVKLVCYNYINLLHYHNRIYMLLQTNSLHL